MMSNSQCGLRLLLAFTACLSLGTAIAQTPADVVRLSAAAEPGPPLRYLFWPRHSDRLQENSMASFSRAVLMATDIGRGDPTLGKPERNEWLSGPWQDAYASDIETSLGRYETVFAELERATNRMEIDYPIVGKEMTGVKLYQLLLPEIQSSRDLARLLMLRSRLEMHRGQWDQFCRTMQTMFRLSDMVGGSNDIIVSKLVAIAIAEQAFARIEEASALPESPNFYWALASIPPKLFEIRNSLDFEVFGVLRAVPSANDLPDEILGEQAAADRLRQFFATLEGLFAIEGGQSDEREGMAFSALAVLGGVKDARDLLRSTPQWADRVDQLSPSEVLLRAIAMRLHQTTGDFIKWHWLPASIRSQYLDQTRSLIANANDGVAAQLEPANALIARLMPALQAVERASLRLKQAQAWLVTQQAIRMSPIDGELVTDLDKLVPPAWPDPFTGEAFGYIKTNATTATMKRSPRNPGDKETSFQIELVK